MKSAIPLTLLSLIGLAGAQVTHFVDFAHQDAQHMPTCYLQGTKPLPLPAAVKAWPVTFKLIGAPLSHALLVTLYNSDCVQYIAPPAVLDPGKRQATMRLPAGDYVIMATGTDVNTEQISFKLRKALTVNLVPTPFKPGE